LVWWFGISPIYFIAGGVVAGVAIAVFNGRKGAKR
jgi:hypothetical protein